MNLVTEPYHLQKTRWPQQGRHILAQFDADTIVVYQAYRPAIGRFAAEHQRFGGPFSLERMSWIKPNFLWMQYRSGWGTKKDQEVTLAVRLRRDAFDTILAEAIHSTHVPEVYGERAAWEQLGKRSDVRLQWDPDHGPSGDKQERRAILGRRSPATRASGSSRSKTSRRSSPSSAGCGSRATARPSSPRARASIRSPIRRWPPSSASAWPEEHAPGDMPFGSCQRNDVSVRPPSIVCRPPVIQPASSLTRNVASAAISSGWPGRPSGCVDLARSRKAA